MEITKEALEDAYLTRKLPIQEIMNLFGIKNAPALYNQLHKHNIMGRREKNQTESKGKRYEEQRKFEKEAQSRFGTYFDYSKMKFKGRYLAVDIICPKHGVISITPARHLKVGCPVCLNNEKMEDLLESLPSISPLTSKEKEALFKKCNSTQEAESEKPMIPSSHGIEIPATETQIEKIDKIGIMERLSNDIIIERIDGGYQTTVTVPGFFTVSGIGVSVKESLSDAYTALHLKLNILNSNIRIITEKMIRL